MSHSPTALAVVHQILVEYRQMTARHHIALNKFRDVEGIVDWELDAYEETSRIQAVEAEDQLSDFMARLTEAFGLPEDRPVTVLGAKDTQYEVTPGRLDDNACELFNNGQCHSFARALSEATGWPTAAITGSTCDDTYENCGMGGQVADGVCICQVGHIVAVRPDGALIDIDGATDPQLVHDSPEHTLVPMSDAMWRLIESSPSWRAPDTEVAETFVEPLLALLGATEVAA
ncbi:hypothetical protein [Streptomyces nigrescens]|uniref:hypothetical protein n=1 Tax=Streptomyces nigrescens TaxID=1920 RepID=UPI0036FA8671